MDQLTEATPKVEHAKLDHSPEMKVQIASDADPALAKLNSESKAKDEDMTKADMSRYLLKKNEVEELEKIK